jgi:HK97 gp10 family phage protein
MSVEMIKNFDAKKAMLDANEKVITKICVNVVNQAKKYAPVNKIIGQGGQLRNSIMMETSLLQYGHNNYPGESSDSKLSAKPKKGEGIVGINLNYAYYQEFGTKYMSPHPYLRPAIALKVYNLPESTVKMMWNSEVALGVNTGGERVKFF